MWRRVTSLSPLFSASKGPFVLNQAAYGLRIWQMFSTEIRSPVEVGTSSRETNPFITFILGGPGSGKGTQCKKIVKNFGFTHISAGDLLREQISSKSKYDAMIYKIIKEGKIVPSEVTVKLLQQAIASSENDKILIDGFPRSEENRLAYERIIGAEPNIVIFLDCPEEEMVKRVLNRNQGRVDDNSETMKKRIKVFTSQSVPVIDYYSKKGKLYKINGTGTVDEVFDRVCQVFTALKYGFKYLGCGIEYLFRYPLLYFLPVSTSLIIVDFIKVHPSFAGLTSTVLIRLKDLTRTKILTRSKSSKRIKV